MNKWDKRFLQLADLVSTWSKDPSTQVGAVIVRGIEIVSTGFNGYPRGVEDYDLRTDDRETRLCKMIHAEENAILFAKQDLAGCVLYTTHPPCPSCAAKIIQVGIPEVVALNPGVDFFERWGDELDITKKMFYDVCMSYSVYSRDVLK